VHVYFNRGLPEVSCPSFVDNNVAFPPQDLEALPEKVVVSLTIGGEKMLHENPGNASQHTISTDAAGTPHIIIMQRT
jgi:hypothetical protein